MTETIRTNNVFRRRMAWGLIVACCGLMFLSRADAAAPPYQYSYNDPGTGIVFDRKTGLHWERAPSPTKYSWTEANAHCSTLGSNWHLPEINQLQTLVDVRATQPPTIDTMAFPNTEPDIYWAKTPGVAADGGSTNNAWSVDFSTGESTARATDLLTAYTRCVY